MDRIYVEMQRMEAEMKAREDAVKGREDDAKGREEAAQAREEAVKTREDTVDEKDRELERASRREQAVRNALESVISPPKYNNGLTNTRSCAARIIGSLDDLNVPDQLSLARRAPLSMDESTGRGNKRSVPDSGPDEDERSSTRVSYLCHQGEPC